jgi:hypothetical protein
VLNRTSATLDLEYVDKLHSLRHAEFCKYIKDIFQGFQNMSEQQKQVGVIWPPKLTFLQKITNKPLTMLFYIKILC